MVNIGTRALRLICIQRKWLARQTRTRQCATLWGIIILGLIGHGASCAEADPRDWTPSDSVAVRYYTGFSLDWIEAAGVPNISASPDGRLFYVLSEHGELACDCIVQTMGIYDVPGVERWLQRWSSPDAAIMPVRTIEMRSHAPSGVVLSAVHWQGSGMSLTFNGPDDGDVRQAFRMDLSSGTLVPLTHDRYGVSSANVQGDSVVYRRLVPVAAPDPSYPAVAVARKESGEAYVESRQIPARLELVAVYRNGDPWLLSADAVRSNPRVWIAPNGRFGILAQADSPAQINPEQHSEENRGFQGADATRSVPAEAFSMIDFEHGRVEPIIEVSKVGDRGPERPMADAFWSADGTHVVLTNTVLPPGLKENTKSGVKVSYLTDYEVSGQRWRVLEMLSDARLQATVGWLTPGKELLVIHRVDGKASSGTVYTLKNGTWVARSVAPSVGSANPAPKPNPLPHGLSVTIRQSANDPPALVACEGHNERKLSSPDPALTGIWRAREEPFTWHVAGRPPVTGGLSMPRHSSSGTLVPLVIQAVHHYYPKLFLPDGPLPTAYATQALVARGMAVLEMNFMDDMPGMGTEREGIEFVTRLDAAVNALAQQHLIDPKRVGVVGFSRGGYLVHYAITHPGQTALAAAEIADSITFNYAAYLAFAPTEFPTREYEAINGGNFWRSKPAWLERETTFNVDRVETPALFTEIGSSGETANDLSAGALATIGAFDLNHRPFEYLFFPTGIHTLARPRERLASLSATVDWMSFWLQGYEDPDSAKAVQYTRWRMIRQHNEERKAREHTTAAQQAGGPSR